MDEQDFPEDSRSPDGRHSVTYVNYHSLGKEGTPLIGGLVTDDGEVDFGRRRFGGPPAWSSDGRYVALPEFVERDDRDGVRRFALQSVVVIDFRDGREAIWPSHFESVWIDSVDSNGVTARTEPGGQSARLDLAGFNWEQMGKCRRPLVVPTTLLEKAVFWSFYLVLLAMLAVVAIPYIAIRWLWERAFPSTLARRRVR